MKPDPNAWKSGLKSLEHILKILEIHGIPEAVLKPLKSLISDLKSEARKE